MTFPLDEVQDTAPLETFYSRNPEEMTDADLEALVEFHRSERDARLAKLRKPKAVAAPKKDQLARTSSTAKTSEIAEMKAKLKALKGAK